MEAAAHDIHAAWMARNPKSDWNAAQHVPYEQLPESEKEKDRAQARLVQRLLTECPQQEGESDAQRDERIANIFGSLVSATCMGLVRVPVEGTCMCMCWRAQGCASTLNAG